LGWLGFQGAGLPLNEKSLIERIRRAATGRGRRPGLGIGDDSAVLPLPRGHEALVTTDFSLEDVHFRREWHPPDSVGHRCLARGLSDIAAMGGIPRAAFLSLALPPELPQSWVDKFIAGLLKLAGEFSVSLAGGDTAQSPDGILADIVVLGSVPAGQAILRSGARPGDFLYVTGTLGSAVAALNELRDGKKLRTRSHPKHFYPQPRLAVGQFLREKKLASAMIDISDGLSTDLGHICEESGAGAVVYEQMVSLVSAVDRVNRFVSGHGLSRAARHARKTGASAPALAGAKAHEFQHVLFGTTGSRALTQSSTTHQTISTHTGDLALTLHGGDEYELLFTARPERRIPKQIAGVPITRIGEILRGDEMRLATADGKTQPLKPAGWEHFG
jgi:thiamine-monophosphate kinase